MHLMVMGMNKKYHSEHCGAVSSGRATNKLNNNSETSALKPFKEKMFEFLCDNVKIAPPKQL